MEIFNRIWKNITSPLHEEATPENLALWEKRAPGWVIQCRKCGLEELFGKYGIRLQASGKK